MYCTAAVLVYSIRPIVAEWSWSKERPASITLRPWLYTAVVIAIDPLDSHWNQSILASNPVWEVIFSFLVVVVVVVTTFSFLLFFLSTSVGLFLRDRLVLLFLMEYVPCVDVSVADGQKRGSCSFISRLVRSSVLVRAPRVSLHVITFTLSRVKYDRPTPPLSPSPPYCFPGRHRTDVVFFFARFVMDSNEILFRKLQQQPQARVPVGWRWKTRERGAK